VETPSAEAVTTLLLAWSRGDLSARDRLFPLVYAELRRRAAGYLRSERQGHTLQPTALVHEAYLRLSGKNAGWQNRTQFFAVSSQIMRRILVDHARARLATKRPGNWTRVTLDEPVSGSREVDLIALDEALDELEATEPRQARMVELRFFGGLTHEEVAAALGVSLATVNREWRLTKAWLYERVEREMS
jgi:RNA polymerase sigma factor (TIGR02999 family)